MRTLVHSWGAASVGGVGSQSRCWKRSERTVCGVKRALVRVSKEEGRREGRRESTRTVGLNVDEVAHPVAGTSDAEAEEIV
jgi:hypothetical protein